MFKKNILERRRNAPGCAAQTFGYRRVQPFAAIAGWLIRSVTKCCTPGILLRHGKHTWKVANVVENQDNTVSFAFATQDGGVIARFAMDTQTGRLRRIG